MTVRTGRRRIAHAVSLFAGSALLLVAAAGSASAAPATAPPRTVLPDDAAAGWLARQFVDGNHLETTFGGVSYPDQGLTIDAVFAFAAAGVADSSAAAAMAWLALPENVTGYIGDGGSEAYSGATAKLLLAAQVQGVSTTFGGVNLPARLRSLQAPSGRFTDRSAFGDFSNAFGQSYAVIALTRTPGGVSAAAVGFLAGSQCADGGFPVTFGAVTCVGDVDATALASQALRAAGRTAAADRGATWLAGRQRSGGGFGAGDGIGAVNANSTGLATQALVVARRVVPAATGFAYLVRAQLRCAAPATERGAVPYDAALGFDPATAARATAQAVLGLSGRGLATLSAAGANPAAPVLAC
jgi:hypothetical protein